MQTMREIIESKGLCTTDKESTHCYGSEFYDREFSNRRMEPVRLLEIGVTSGSMQLWREYFPNAQSITGIDATVDATLKSLDQQLKRDSRFNLIEHDAYDTALMPRLRNFDIIIDDGPHTLESQISVLFLYLPRLNDGGILVIEDVQSLDWIPRLKKAVPVDGTYQWNSYDLRHIKGRYDDILFVVKKTR